MRQAVLAEAHRAVSFDVETHLIKAGLSAPPLVCGSVGWFDRECHTAMLVAADATQEGRHDQAAQILAQVAGHVPLQGRLLDEAQAVALFCELLDSDRMIAGANIAFDLLVMAVRLARDGVDAMPGIFRALLDQGRIFDVQHAEALDAIAEGCLNMDPRTGGGLINPETGRRGRYSLATCVDLVLGRKDAKANDEWRQSYAELHGHPIEQWPRTARDYPVDDAINTIETMLAQAGVIARTSGHKWGARTECEWCGMRPQEVFAPTGEAKPCRTRRRSRNIHDLANQVATAFAMHAGAAYGFHVNQGSVDLIEADALDGREAAILPFIEVGLLKRNRDGTVSRDMAAISARVALAYGARIDAPCQICAGTRKVPSEKNPKSKINCKACAATGFNMSVAPDVPKTDTGRVGTGRDVLNESADEVLLGLADHQEDSKTLEVYVPYLRSARVARDYDPHGNPIWADIPLTLWPNVLLETGRTSYGGVIQLFPRKPGHWILEGPRKGQYVPSLRECVEARPGCVFSAEDYEAGELVTHGQSCIWITGDSQLARALVAGRKVHNALGATMIGLSYDDFQGRLKEQICKDARQAAKPGNFGFPGGMGAVKMVLQQRKQGPDTPHPNGPTWIKDDSGKPVRGYKGLRFCLLMDKADACGTEKLREWKKKPIPPTCRRCIECAVRLKDAWLTQWPENTGYFAFINGCIEDGQTITAEMLRLWPHLAEVYYPGQQLAPGEVMQHVSGRIRQTVTATTESPYCSAANGFFQGLLADAAKSALRRISRECYDNTVRIGGIAHPNSKLSRFTGGPSPLLGSRAIVFAHDEIILEHPESVAHEGAKRVQEIMIEELRWYCPDLAEACAAEPTLMRKWYKGASPVYARGGAKPADDYDRLIPWEPAARKAA